MSFHLKVVAGPDKGKSFQVPFAGLMTVGRGEDVTVELTDSYVSRTHFQLIVAGEFLRLRDSGSKTGTLVNTVRVSTEQALKPGDIIMAGETCLHLVAGTGDSARHSPLRPADHSSATSRALSQPPRPGTPEALASLIGSTLGYFTLGPVLGTGRSGTVFCARNNRDRSDVALKVFVPGFSSDEEGVQRFIRAAKTIAPLRHLNLVDLYNAGRVDGYCWLSMELIDGPSVTWLVRQAVEESDWRVAQRVLVHVTRALIYLHGNRVVHRNLTPENLLMSSADGLVKVGDLITAKAREGKLAETVTAHGHIVGDLRYLAPERTEGDPQASDPRSDLYSLGAVVYAVLTGRPPLEGADPVDTIRKVRLVSPPPPHKFRPNISPALESVVLRLLSKNPDRRFEDATELLRHLVSQRLIEA